MKRYAMIGAVAMMADTVNFIRRDFGLRHTDLPMRISSGRSPSGSSFATIATIRRASIQIISFSELGERTTRTPLERVVWEVKN